MRRRLRVLSLRRIPETRMLINCAAYQDGKKLGDIAPEDISKYVSRPECFVWVAMKDPGPGELAAMQHEFDLHELAVEDARHGHQRPKIEEYGDSLFAVLHNIEVVGGEIKMGEVDVFVGRNFVLSVRNKAEPGFAAVRARCEREPELLKHGAGFVFYALIDAVVDRYSPCSTQSRTNSRSSRHRFSPASRCAPTSRGCTT